MPKPVWEIKLLVETDDDEVVERMASAISSVACPVPPTELTPEHQCRYPWLVVRSELDAEEAEGWRETLNR